MIEATIQLDGGGWFVEWFDEDTERVSRWYGGRTGGREACNNRAKQDPPPADDSSWVAISEEGAPPYDAATATGMYDRY